MAAVIARADGDTDWAETLFRECVELEPDHHDAALELRLIERRKQKKADPTH